MLQDNISRHRLTLLHALHESRGQGYEEQFMSTSTWGEQPEANSDVYTNRTFSLTHMLKSLLKPMMTQFSAQGACVALYDEGSRQMRIRLHVRLQSTGQPRFGTGSIKLPGRPTTGRLENDGASARKQSRPLTGPLQSQFPLTTPTPGRTRTGPLQAGQVQDELEDVTPQQSGLFVVGSSYPKGVDLIGHSWLHNMPYLMKHEEYLSLCHDGNPLPFHTDVLPTNYLVVPIREATLLDQPGATKVVPAVIGIVVLYQLPSYIGQSFLTRMRAEALHYTEHIALYLQNEHLRRKQRRTSKYMQGLQEISITFPASVQLDILFEKVYEFASQVVDISSFLITLYDRDAGTTLDKQDPNAGKITDKFAIRDGNHIILPDGPEAEKTRGERPVWTQVMLTERRSLFFSPANEPEENQTYNELLTGAWGDQRQAASFLLLPMKMFSRVIGSVALTSMQGDAYRQEDIQILETMVQIVTVSIENDKLYKKNRQSLSDAQAQAKLLMENNEKLRLRESELADLNSALLENNEKLRLREFELAALNSALQTISSMLDLDELLKNFVNTVASLLKTELCVFFQLTPEKEHMVAKAVYAPPSTNKHDDESLLPTDAPFTKKDDHDDLLEQIRFPFKGTLLEKRVQDEGFIYLGKSDLEELAEQSDEGGLIFLNTMSAEQMIMIPVSYQGNVFGMLFVHAPSASRYFHPREVGMLLAICAQTASAIRNAQLFEQTEEAYAELKRMDILKDEFLVTASHELRTPLSGILGYASLLKKQSESERILPKQALRFATKIESSAQQLSDLVASMTEAAKIGAHDKKLELHLEPVQILKMADLASNVLSINIEQQIVLHVDPTFWVIADALHLRQVVTNLLDNAAKYSPGTARIELSANAMTLAEAHTLLPPDERDHHHESDGMEQVPVILVRVRDEGEGIAPDDQKKIFEKFVRAPRSLTTPVRGSGLGLFICRRYIEAMNGRLWLESSIPNEGSAFSFYLPRIQKPVEIGEQEDSEYQSS